MKKYFYTFLATTVFIIFSIGYYESFNSINQSPSTTSNFKYARSLGNECDESQKEEYDFINKYPKALQCNIDSPEMSPFETRFLGTSEDFYDFSKPASNKTHNLRIVRGIVVYFPIGKYENFLLEFKWMYRSWIEMQKYESIKWRTDLIVFLDTDNKAVMLDDFLMKDLNCSLNYRLVEFHLFKLTRICYSMS